MVFTAVTFCGGEQDNAERSSPAYLNLYICIPSSFNDHNECLLLLSTSVHVSYTVGPKIIFQRYFPVFGRGAVAAELDSIEIEGTERQK